MVGILNKLSYQTFNGNTKLDQIRIIKWIINLDTYHSKTMKTLHNATYCWQPKDIFLTFTDGLTIFVKLPLPFSVE